MISSAAKTSNPVRPSGLFAGLQRFVERKRAKRRLKHLSPDQVFNDIYRLNSWKSGESISGIGSELSQTQRIIDALPQWFQQLDIKRVVDVPCGDFHWMQHVDLSNVEYIGCDIVEDLIAANQKYASPNVSFLHKNLLSDPLPAADLVFCRDCLVHFSFEHIHQALANIRSSGAKYLLTTSFTEREENTDIVTGRWRPLNLQAAPFHLSEPKAVLVEECTQDGGQYTDKVLALWSIDQLPA
ncbi:hypothetical protein FF011L_13260 [Roseimaritima multifibrata]|uniref:Methyltransferase domain-containing protein n=1 Tax=Roseimaritima multifibrata TaxID=1930274 RepID=A0A517MCG1_9BACT|nr:class I SAM-dependent methyltransferase [Roseimaritima multifibrata]QDS92579.1 hypothetical protein FF011L_13260 [Roseimaritima multifibrata]